MAAASAVLYPTATDISPLLALVRLLSLLSVPSAETTHCQAPFCIMGTVLPSYRTNVDRCSIAIPVSNRLSNNMAHPCMNAFATMIRHCKAGSTIPVMELVALLAMVSMVLLVVLLLLALAVPHLPSPILLKFSLCTSCFVSIELILAMMNDKNNDNNMIFAIMTT